MKKFSAIMWGLVLIALGVILGGNALGWFNINIFFKGWWTLFIIVPCFISLITHPKEWLGDLIGILIGVSLLLACQDVISFSSLWKLLVPAIIILIGLSIIFKNLFSQKFDKAVSKLNEKFDKNDESGAVFGGTNINMAGKEFKGKNLSAVFGAIKLDLREAKIKEDVIINATAVFGGIDIYVPDNVVVETKSNSFFGGVSNKTTFKAKGKAPTIYVNGMALFGGVEVK
ncbi:MAG: LiaF-related protein [Candidatus Saccharibacteria bacterium]|nr:LiaF-related protein [Candidatus Saccharibacteria bacterium]